MCRKAGVGRHIYEQREDAVDKLQSNTNSASAVLVRLDKAYFVVSALHNVVDAASATITLAAAEQRPHLTSSSKGLTAFNVQLDLGWAVAHPATDLVVFHVPENEASTLPAKARAAAFDIVGALQLVKGAAVAMFGCPAHISGGSKRHMSGRVSGLNTEHDPYVDAEYQGALRVKDAVRACILTVCCAVSWGLVLVSESWNTGGVPSDPVPSWGTLGHRSTYTCVSHLERGQVQAFWKARAAPLWTSTATSSASTWASKQTSPPPPRKQPPRP